MGWDETVGAGGSRMFACSADGHAKGSAARRGDGGQLLGDRSGALGAAAGPTGQSRSAAVSRRE